MSIKLAFGAAFLFFVQIVSPALAEVGQGIVPQSQAQMALSFAPVAKKASPAVVNIYTRKVVSQRIFSPFMDDPLFQHFFGGVPRSMTRKRMENALGSGVLVRSDGMPYGMIVTSNHVIAGADQITVVLSDKREFEATLLTADEKVDLAVLKLEAKAENLPYLELKDSDDVEVGDLVLAIGNPFGVGQTVTSGIVSAKARSAADLSDSSTYIQTDAAINPGNSGGALVTMDGKLIGINTAIYSKSGGSMGIGFAVPSNLVNSIMRAGASGKKTVARAWVGVDVQAVTAEIAASLGMDKPVGVLVKRLHPASPAREAGIQIGDIIESVNGKSVEDPSDFRYRLAVLPLGENVRLEVLRKGHRSAVLFRLAPAPENPARDETAISGRSPLAGISIGNASPALLEELQLPDDMAGVIVLKTDRTQPAARLGIRKGDRIVEVNGEEVSSVRDLLPLLKGDQPRWIIILERDGQLLRLAVGR